MVMGVSLQKHNVSGKQITTDWASDQSEQARIKERTVLERLSLRTNCFRLFKKLGDVHFWEGLGCMKT